MNAVLRSVTGVCAAAALSLAVAALASAVELLTPVSAAGAGSNELHPRWSPTGRYLSLERDDGTSRTVEVYAADPGPGLRLVETLALRPAADGLGFLLDGAAQGSTYNAWIAWAPDESRFAFVSSGGIGQYDLYLSAVGRGGAAERLTNDAAADGQVAWSPVGDRLAFVSGRTDRGDLYLLDLATRAVTRLTAEGRSVLHPEWSPDGRRLAFAVGEGENHDVCVMDVPAGEAAGRAPARRCLTAWPFDDLRPRWSPDGRRIAFYSSYNAEGEPGVWSLFVVAADGSDPVKGEALLARRVDTGVVVDLDVGPAFTPDGGGLVYAKRVDRDFNPLYLADLAARTARRLVTGQSIHHDVALAPDGRLALRAQVARWDRVLTGRLRDLVAATAAEAPEARR
ncbi:MAG TPA: hypothetical protein VF406_11890 [Thermodesulfobacteriota bacterium]